MCTEEVEKVRISFEVSKALRLYKIVMPLIQRLSWYNSFQKSITMGTFHLSNSLLLFSYTFCFIYYLQQTRLRILGHGKYIRKGWGKVNRWNHIDWNYLRLESSYWTILAWLFVKCSFCLKTYWNYVLQFPN